MFDLVEHERAVSGCDQDHDTVAALQKESLERNGGSIANNLQTGRFGSLTSSSKRVR